jgi:hypothetical protein
MIAVPKSKKVRKSQKNITPPTTPEEVSLPTSLPIPIPESTEDVPKKLSYRQKQIIAIGIDAVRAKEKIARDALKLKKKSLDLGN